MFQLQSKDWPGVAKVLEESSELNVNLAKLMATNGDASYWGGVNLRDEITDEIADTLAAIYFFLEFNPQINFEHVKDRWGTKAQKYRKWRANGEG